MLFCFTKTLVGGCPRTPEATDARHVHGRGGAGAGSPWWRTQFAGPPPAVRPSRARLHPIPHLDHPPRGCRAPRSEARNRGYSYPSWRRVRALQAIPRPWIPPNRPPNAQNGRESGFRARQGGGGSMTRMGCHPVGQGPAHGRILKPAPVTAKLPAGEPSRDHVGMVVGHDEATLGRGSRDRVRGMEHLAARRPVAGRKRRGQRGRSPPPASAGDAHGVCGPTE